MNEQFINDLSKELAKLGTIHSVGEEWISYTGKIPSGGIPYCGQEVTRETYSALWSWVQAQGLVKPESEWQSIASSQNGNVPFYSSGNGTTTFRVPKLIGYVKGASSQAESGDYIKEGLPNVVGGLASIPYTSAETSGAFRLSNGIVYAAVQGGTDAAFTTATADFDASRSNPIYGRSLSVTPETSCVLFGVYAFGTVSNPSDLNVSNLAADVDSIKTNYLPLSGGTMTGGITSKNVNFVKRDVTDSYITIQGGTSWSEGACLEAFGKDHSASPGRFRLWANNGTNVYDLTGAPDGALAWGGKSIERVNSIGADWIRYESGLQIVWGRADLPSNSKNGMITLPVSFLNSENYRVLATYIDTDNQRSYVVSSSPVSGASFKLMGINGLDGAYNWVRSHDYIALGKWK